VAAFGRDPDSSKQVWSADEGYPGDFWYRDFYRDIGFDLDYDYVRPYLPPTGQRIHTGLKYHRITGKTDQKEPYDPERARSRVQEHADHFVETRLGQVAWLARQMERPPIVVCPYDAELFGHWWFEGPWWLEMVFRRLAETSLWSAALARVVPELATDVWDRLEDGEEVRLAPVLDPAWTTLTWWAWGPTAVASVAIGGAGALGIAAVLASAERVVVFALAHARRIRLDRAGIAIRDGRRGRVIPWSRVEVARVEQGIRVADRDGAATVIRAGLRNFWIALPVIELRATLAPHCPSRVTFRARCADGGLAVVGEVDTVA